MLRLKNITKDYVLTGNDTVHALKGISLNFRANEFVAILGPSGCGKTTLMNIVGGLDKYTSGELSIDGKTTSAFTDAEWDNYRNKRVGFVFQNYNLISHLTVLSNVELALTLSGVAPEERKRRALDALKRVGLAEQYGKKPNQLSGGQMQRVAIARALVNSPEILLADEPTGALDTATSEQIMELIRELSAEKLVIMVTHNPSLAEKYSTRTVKMLDGEIISDSDPYDGNEEKPTSEQILSIPDNNVSEPISEKEEKSADDKTERNSGFSAINRIKDKRKNKAKKEKTSMSFLTALSLSFRNLITKKGRTILTSIAGSIGIIGIALILAISNGMNAFISKTTTETMSANPITIETEALNLEAAMEAMTSSSDIDIFPAAEKIFIQRNSGLSQLISKNKITAEYVDYLKENLDKAWYNDVLYKTGQELNVLTEFDGAVRKVGQTSSWQMLVTNDLVGMQYDILAGRLPEGENDLLIIVDEYNRIDESTLINLGFTSAEAENDSLDFSEVLGKTYRVLSSDEAYAVTDGRIISRNTADISASAGLEASVCGIVRIKEDTDLGALSTGIGYTKELYNAIQERNIDSECVKVIKSDPTVDAESGELYVSDGRGTAEEKYEQTLRKYGGISTPNYIAVYAKDFDAKAEIKEVLDAYNDTHEEKIVYTDLSELMGDMLSSMVDVISYVLIGFTAISLIVSSVMIGIITYVSVIERTKEIGILRAIGARKKDIARVFNAETFIIGFFAGLVGVVVAAILTVPVNAIISVLAGVGGIASLNVLHCVILIAVSICLTLISGLIPASKASRKDPVTALRTE